MPALLSETDSRDLLEQLIAEVSWHSDAYVAFGRRFEIPRLQAWFAAPGIQYRYSNNLLPTHDWLPCLWQLKQQIETLCHCDFNSVLATYYRDGWDYVGWHADDETELGPTPWIASLSLGAEREFRFRHKQDGWEGCVPLPPGALLLMEPAFQQHWLHSVPEQPAVHQPRINLTFRKVVNMPA